MPTSRDQRRKWQDEEHAEIERDLSFFHRLTVKHFVIFLILLAFFGTIIWLWFVGTSGLRGMGNAVEQKNRAENWTRAQADFQRRYNSILSMDREITIAFEEMEKAPGNQVKEINYSGLRRGCISAVGEYNALAQTYTARDFRDASLPERIDDTDPKTDCKEG